jgi:hypothetical protein
MNKTTSKVIVILVLGLVVLFGIGQFFAFSPANNNSAAAPSTSQTPPTQVIAFVATQPSSAPTQNGSCFASSIAAPYRTDAWRCSVGNSISDPCFQISGNNNLLCAVNPAEGSYATSTFVLHLTKALPKATPPSGPKPTNWAWAVQLADGTYCTPFTGTRPFTASGVVGNYACSSPNSSENMIFGDLNASSSVWMAEVGSLNPSTSSLPTLGYTAEAPVTTVWQ